MPILAPEQCRAARAWLSLSQDDLASLSGVSRRTVAFFETKERVPHDRTLRDLARVFEERGVEVLFEGDRPAGLRVRDVGPAG